MFNTKYLTSVVYFIFHFTPKFYLYDNIEQQLLSNTFYICRLTTENAVSYNSNSCYDFTCRCGIIMSFMCLFVSFLFYRCLSFDLRLDYPVGIFSFHTFKIINITYTTKSFCSHRLTSYKWTNPCTTTLCM
jgi:hypothetical protein